MILQDRLNDSYMLNHIGNTSIIADDLIRSLCGKRLGAGVTRMVYEYNLDPEKYVIKLETENSGANRREYDLWDEIKWYEGDLEFVKKWFAPCLWLSPGGKLLVQRRTKRIDDVSKVPDRVPAFLTDLKPDNFGFIGKQLVCHDYSSVIRGGFTKKTKSSNNIKYW